MAETYRYSLMILEHHLDTFGHVNNAKFFEIFEEARWDQITSNGYGVDEVIRSGVGPVVLEAHVKFRKEVRLREKISVTSQWTRKSSKLTSAHQEIRNSKEELCAAADFTFGLFDTQRRKLVRVSEKWLHAVGIIENSISALRRNTV